MLSVAMQRVQNFCIMNRIKKAAKVLTFVILIILAGIGVGISGGVPLPTIKSRRDNEKDNIELLEHQDEKKGHHQGQSKK